MSKLALVVDDEESLREIICETLKLLEIEAVEAENGSAAIEEIDKLQKLDLIILDMNMPHMSGEEAYELMSKKFPDTAVIFMSGFDMQETLDKIKVGHKKYFLKKPFTITAMHKVVSELLELN